MNFERPPQNKIENPEPFENNLKNIQEVFKLSPELENIAIEATKSGESIFLYRIENKNIEKEPDGITSHKDLKGQWFSPDLETALVYLRKSQQTFGTEAKRVEGANLVVVKIPKEEFENLHVSKHPIASQMDVENDNYIVPENIERSYINLDDVQDKVGNFENLQKAKEQIKEKVKQFETKEAVELYCEYLKTIFPESKVQDIVWHGTNSTESFDEFDIERESSFGFKKHGAVFFTSNIEDAKTRGSGDVNKKAEKIIPALVNIKNPLVSGEKDAENEYEDVVAEGKEEIEKVLSIEDVKKKWEEKGWKDRIEGDNLILTKLNKYKQIGLFDNKNNLVADLSHNIGFIGDIKESQTKEWKELGFDGIIDDTHIAKLSGLGGDKTWIAIFDPKDSHILGSQNDIDQFKKWKESSESVIDNKDLKNKYSQEIIDYVWKRLAKEGITNADSIIGTRESIKNEDFEKFWNSVKEEDIKNLITAYKESKRLQLAEFEKYKDKYNEGDFVPETGTMISQDTSWWDNKISDLETLLK